MFGGKFVDTSDSDDECDLSLWFNKEVSGLLCASLGVNKCFVGSGVLVGILFSILSSESSLLGTVLLGSIAFGFASSEKFGVTGRLLLDVLRNYSCPKTHQQMS